MQPVRAAPHPHFPPSYPAAARCQGVPTEMSSDSADLSLGILGVLTIVPVIVQYICTWLPNAQLHYFDELVAETESYLLSLEEQGVFRNPSTAAQFRSSLLR